MEGRVVEGQVLTKIREDTETELQREVITDLKRFNAIALEWDDLVERSSRIKFHRGSIPK